MSVLCAIQVNTSEHRIHFICRLRFLFDLKIDDEKNIKIANRNVKKREYCLQQVCERAKWNLVPKTENMIIKCVLSMRCATMPCSTECARTRSH